MEGKKISECGGYKKVHCLDNIVGSGYELNNGSVYPVYEGTCGVYLYVNGHKIYTTSARFVEHVEEVQLSEPDYAPVEQDDVLSAPLTASDGVMVKRSVYDDLIRAGWTDELLIDEGYIVPLQEPIAPEQLQQSDGNPKYDKTINGKYGTGSCTVDVYRILDGFNVTNPQLQHLIKKALNVGVRGHKDERQDLIDILHSAQSALDMFDDKNGRK